jgi:predicted ATP-dependent endonuclease of OLD family
LKQVGQLGYPGVANPRLVIRSTLNPVVVLSSADGAQVHYALSDDPADGELTLPDRYNGLGYKNLIYMVIELFDLHSQWLETKEDRPPLHLVFIEEPEAHLHMQLQQVFIRKVLDILKVKPEEVPD